MQEIGPTTTSYFYISRYLSFRASRSTSNVLQSDTSLKFDRLPTSLCPEWGFLSRCVSWSQSLHSGLYLPLFESFPPMSVSLFLSLSL
jgi:hypothetical protein